MKNNKLRGYRLVFSNGQETTVSARSLAEMKRKVWEVWRAFLWNEESVVVEEVETGKKWAAERIVEAGMWPKWKEVK